MNQNSNNVAYLQSALRSLEDRYKKLQLRTESLQSENERLVASRTELMVEVERLQDQHIRLRERNLRLTQEFHSKQQECSLLAEKLTMFARGRVSGNSNTGSGSSSFKSGLTQVQEDTEGSSDSLVTVALHGGMVSHPHTALTVSNRTWSEPNLSVIQRELEMVRKGLWSPTTVENQGSTSEEVLSKIMPGFKKSQSELEQQFSRMIEDQPHLLLDGAEEKRLAGIPPGSHTVFNNEVDSVTYVHHCTRSAVALHDKLTNQNQVLRKLQQLLKMPRGKVYYDLSFTCKRN